MARIDKYDPVDGGFRAPLNAAYTGSATAVGASINSSGRVLPGAAGQTGFVGMLCMPNDLAAGAVVDIMTDGELVDLSGLAAGTVYYLHATTGALQTTQTIYRVGHTVEATRLVVRFQVDNDTLPE